MYNTFFALAVYALYAGSRKCPSAFRTYRKLLFIGCFHAVKRLVKRGSADQGVNKVHGGIAKSRIGKCEAEYILGRAVLHFRTHSAVSVHTLVCNAVDLAVTDRLVCFKRCIVKDKKTVFGRGKRRIRILRFACDRADDCKKHRIVRAHDRAKLFGLCVRQLFVEQKCFHKNNFVFPRFSYLNCFDILIV